MPEHLRAHRLGGQRARAKAARKQPEVPVGGPPAGKAQPADPHRRPISAHLQVLRRSKERISCQTVAIYSYSLPKRQAKPLRPCSSSLARRRAQQSGNALPPRGAPLCTTLRQRPRFLHDSGHDAASNTGGRRRRSGQRKRPQPARLRPHFLFDRRALSAHTGR